MPNPSLNLRANGMPPGPRYSAGCIFCSAGLAACRCLQVSSNVRHQKTDPTFQCKFFSLDLEAIQMSISSQNIHVVEFLNYYCKLASPQYAIMLHAPWGAGKTWFIKEYLKNLRPDSKPIYVTLNGVSSKGEIEEQFFEQMHPLLSHKITKVGAKVLKGLLKGTLQIDWDVDGKADGSASIGAPEVGIKDFLTKSKNGSIIIFDDIERCQLPLPQLLGYINYFVEHDDTRVVLLANEQEIFAKEERDGSGNTTSEELQYQRVREKLIGKSFAISPDLNSAHQIL